MKSTNRTPGRCFVISPIGQEGSEVRRHADEVFRHIILPAVERFGLKASRSDHLDDPGKISDQMFERILNDDLCIAVLTGFNPNVFYELAIAQFARRPVIIMLEKGNDLPFDVQDLRYVPYDFWPSSIVSGECVDALVKQIDKLRAGGWKVPPLSGKLARFGEPVESPTDIKFFERSGNFGDDRAWLGLLNDAKTSISIMGVALLSWVMTDNFEQTVIQKLREGCHIRVMTLHEKNDSIDALNYSNKIDESAKHVKEQIHLSSKTYLRLDSEYQKFEFRKLRDNTPNFALTLTDQSALMVQYLHSLNWGLGPHLQCNPESPLYRIVENEFNKLWESAEIASKEEAEETQKTGDS